VHEKLGGNPPAGEDLGHMSERNSTDVLEREYLRLDSKRIASR